MLLLLGLAQATDLNLPKVVMAHLEDVNRVITDHPDFVPKD